MNDSRPGNMTLGAKLCLESKFEVDNTQFLKLDLEQFKTRSHINQDMLILMFIYFGLANLTCYIIFLGQKVDFCPAGQVGRSSAAQSFHFLKTTTLRNPMLFLYTQTETDITFLVGYFWGVYNSAPRSRVHTILGQDVSYKSPRALYSYKDPQISA